MENNLKGNKMNGQKNWDRVTNFCCGYCMYFAPKPNTATGRCRRHAPSMQGYPNVFPDTDWCGDHKIGTNSSKEQLKPKAPAPLNEADADRTFKHPGPVDHVRSADLAPVR